MQITKKLSIFFLLLSTSFTAFSQHQVGVCGTQPSIIADKQLDDNIKYLEEHGEIITDRELKYVPIRFTIVRSATGAGGVAIKNIFRLLCRLNIDYADQEIQFYMKDDFKYLNNDAANNDPQGSGGNILRNNKDPKGLNMFFVADIKSDSPGNILGFFSPEHDYVVIKNGEVNFNSQTTSHELGHFFSLRHTFWGWECGQWTEAEYGMQVAETHVSCSGALIELVNGSNCSTSADRVCDTPPDYNFGFGWPNDCRPFNLNVLDKNGDLIRPSQNNFMSYFFGCSDYHFTPGQKSLIHIDLSSSKRAYLKSTYVPPATTISETINYLSPIDSNQVLRDEPIVLNWAPVDGATFYLVEYTRNKSFGSAVTTVEMVNTNQFTIPKSTFATNYGYWRVAAMNPYNTCNVANDFESFNVVDVLGNKEISELTNWTLKPSLISSNDQVNIALNATESLDIQINVTSSSGQNVLSGLNKKLLTGENQIELNDLSLSPGIYIVSLKSKNGISSKKLVVQ